MKVLICLVVLVASVEIVQATPFSLNTDYIDLQKQPQARLSSEEVRVLNQYHFVFIAGFLNEGARKRYFKDNFSTLKENGIETLSMLFPSSQKAIATNVALLTPEIAKLFRQGNNKPIILFGHSKGGVEALSLVLGEPQLLGHEISRIVTLQAPLNGNSFLDHWVPPSRWVHFSSLEGIDSMRRESVYNVVHRKYFELAEEDKQKFTERTYFISTSRLPAEVSFLFRLPGYMLLRKLNEPSDGIVSVSNMVLDLFGQNMGHVKADHTELVVAHVPGLNISSPEKTRAFTLALFKNLFKAIQGDSIEKFSAASSK